MKRKIDFLLPFLIILLLILYPICIYSSTKVDNLESPNIVLIMADDVGCEILGCYGGTSYKTPNIDNLAETGIRFTHCYSTPLCSPSRVTIMTGRYTFRTTEKWGFIPPSENTFGHILKSAGYATALAGKWQMCLLNTDPMHVMKMGFDENCCFGWHEGSRYYQPHIWQNGKILNDVADRFGPDVYCEFLIDFITKNKDRPFLAYYPMAVAHEITNDLETPPPTGPDGRYQSYQELIEYMDILVGRIIKALERLELRDNTLILFTTDNGTPREFITRFENGNYIKEPIISKKGDESVRGGKGRLTDAGTHVPLIANWSGVSPAGKVCDDLIDFSDFMPTLAELARAQIPQNITIDGTSFAAQLQGKTARPREWIYTQWEGKSWIRTKRWKLYSSGLLYDMTNDPSESFAIKPSDDTEESAQIREKLQTVLTNLKTKSQKP
jgi:arylsulfatase A